MDTADGGIIGEATSEFTRQIPRHTHKQHSDYFKFRTIKTRILKTLCIYKSYEYIKVQLKK